jgi:hypothetical protein
MSKDREENAETIREAITRRRAIVPTVDPVIAEIKGSNPEMNITSTIASEPAIPPKPLERDFPYPARISVNFEYIRVEATVAPSQTPP